MAASTSGKIRIASAYETNPSPQGPPMVQPFSPGVPSGDLIQPVQTKSEGRQTPTAPELEVLRAAHLSRGSKAFDSDLAGRDAGEHEQVGGRVGESG